MMNVYLGGKTAFDWLKILNDENDKSFVLSFLETAQQQKHISEKVKTV